jgi:hypothetical protein
LPIALRDKSSRVSGPQVFVIRFSSGRALKVQDGTVVTAEDFLGLGSSGTGKGFAEVTKHPNDPRILGLKNLCGSAWLAPAPGGGPRKIEPGKSVTLSGGLRIHFGSAVGTIREGPGGFALSPSVGSGIPLRAGLSLTASDVMGMRTAHSGDPAAQVARHPNDATLLGLRNLTSQSWSAVVPDGGLRRIEPGKTIKLAPGTRIDFGFISGEIEAIAPAAQAKSVGGIQSWLAKSLTALHGRPVAALSILLVVLIPLLAVGWFALRGSSNRAGSSKGGADSGNSGERGRRREEPQLSRHESRSESRCGGSGRAGSRRNRQTCRDIEV